MPKTNIFGNRVTAAELAEILGITRQHLTRLCRAGSVPNAYQTKGGHWRFRWSAKLEAMVRVPSRGPGFMRTGSVSGQEVAIASRYLKSCIGNADPDNLTSVERSVAFTALKNEEDRLAIAMRMVKKRRMAIERAIHALIRPL